METETEIAAKSFAMLVFVRGSVIAVAELFRYEAVKLLLGASTTAPNSALRVIPDVLDV